jgi:transposase
MCAGVQHDTYGHREHRGDAPYGIRRVARRGADKLTSTPGCGCWPVSKPATIRVKSPPLGCQELRTIYRCRDRNQAAARLYDWTIASIDSGVAELTRLSRTITTWPDEFLA